MTVDLQDAVASVGGHIATSVKVCWAVASVVFQSKQVTVRVGMTEMKEELELTSSDGFMQVARKIKTIAGDYAAEKVTLDVLIADINRCCDITARELHARVIGCPRWW